MSGVQEEINIDKILNKLHDKQCNTINKAGNTKKIEENEIRAVCIQARQIFLDQPILLELEAPLKVCGKLSLIQEISMDST